MASRAESLLNSEALRVNPARKVITRYLTAVNKTQRKAQWLWGHEEIDYNDFVAYRKRLDGVIDEYEKITRQWAMTAVPQSYNKGIDLTDIMLKQQQKIIDNEGNIVKLFDLTPRDKTAINNTVNRLKDKTFREVKMMTDKMRDRADEIIRQGMKDFKTRRQTGQQIKDMINRNALTLKDSRGATWSAERYSAMYSRTRTREFQSEAIKDRMLENKQELIQISEHLDIDGMDICNDYEGNVYSLTGDSDKYPKIDMLPPFHPNCAHVPTPWVEKYQTAPEDKKATKQNIDELNDSRGLKKQAKENIPDKKKPLTAEKYISRQWVEATDERLERTVQYLVRDAKGLDSLEDVTQEMVEEYKKQAQKMVEELLKNAQPRIRVPAGSAFEGIINDGRFKSQFETATSSGMLNNKTRAKFEKSFFGIAEDEKFNRPIYGYLMEEGKQVPSSHRLYFQYGEIDFRLKDTAKDKVTFCFGDSLDTNYGRGKNIPSPLNKPSWKSGGYHDERLNPLKMKNLTPRNTYVEMQVHEGVSLEDVEEIVIPEGFKIKDSLLKKIKSKNIKVKVRSDG